MSVCMMFNVLLKLQGQKLNKEVTLWLLEYLNIMIKPEWIYNFVEKEYRKEKKKKLELQTHFSVLQRYKLPKIKDEILCLKYNKGSNVRMILNLIYLLVAVSAYKNEKKKKACHVFLLCCVSGWSWFL